LPVTQADELMSVGFIFLYSSAIQAISVEDVPISGAGTFCEGLIKSLLISSCANLLVIFSISFLSQSILYFSSWTKHPLQRPLWSKVIPKG
jgi:hypothetical protein